MDDKNRVILIGLDGLGYQEIGPWLSDETLTVLNSLSNNGVGSTLYSTHPPWTPCAWPSLLSGRNPGSHGVFDFFTNENYEKTLINRLNVDAPYLFEVADASGSVPVVINYPVTHPASRLNRGAVIPGYLASEDEEFYPPELRPEYENTYGKYRIYPQYGDDHNPVEEYTRVARHRRDMARFLDERYDWDLLAVQFQVTDSIFHDLDDREEIKQVLKNIDEFVGDIIALGGDNADIFVVSDHGMGDYDWTFYINSWLAENGYCETTTGDEQYFWQTKQDLKNETDDKKSATAVSIIETLIGGFSIIGLSPRRIHRGLGAIGLDKVVERLIPDEALVAAQTRIVDYKHSVAYQILFNSLGIHLNVEDRESHGIVLAEDYGYTRDKLIEELSQVRDPDGNLVFDDVLRREDIYEGPHIQDAPDIILIPREYRYDVSGSLVNTFRRNHHKNHKPEGILISNRDLNIDPETGASIHDIAPTVAAALGLPVDTETDGRIISPFDTGDRADWGDVAGDYREGLKSAGTSPAVEDRLANLGYME